MFQSSTRIPKIRRVRKDYPGEWFIWIRVEGAFVTSCTLIFSRDILKTFFMGKQTLHFKNAKTRPCQLTDFFRVYNLIVVVF